MDRSRTKDAEDDARDIRARIVWLLLRIARAVFMEACGCCLVREILVQSVGVCVCVCLCMCVFVHACARNGGACTRAKYTCDMCVTLNAHVHIYAYITIHIECLLIASNLKVKATNPEGKRRRRKQENEKEMQQCCSTH